MRLTMQRGWAAEREQRIGQKWEKPLVKGRRIQDGKTPVPVDADAA